MSGLDNSQPITDATVLGDDDAVEKPAEDPTAKAAKDDRPVNPEELGDATPGPR